MAYDRGGAEKWVNRYDGPAHFDDRAIDIVADEEGNVYVTGWSLGSDYLDDIVTMKYDSNGAEQWVVRFDSAGGGWNRSQAIAVDAAGNVYLAATSYHPEDENLDYSTIKYGANGELRWVRNYDGPAHGDDEAVSLAIDRFGDVYVTGKSRGDDRSTDIVTLKYDPDGNLRWLERYDESRGRNAEPVSMGVDAHGDLIVAGTTSKNEWSILTIIKYAQDVLPVSDPDSSVPGGYRLAQNHPNPFNPKTDLEFAIADRSFVTLSILDILGREVALLVHEVKSPGMYTVSWDAAGRTSGVYFCRLQAGKFIDVKKLLLIK